MALLVPGGASMCNYVVTPSATEHRPLFLSGNRTRFGTFFTITRAKRAGRNARTGEPFQIPASQSVAVNPSKALKNAVN